MPLFRAKVCTSTLYVGEFETVCPVWLSELIYLIYCYDKGKAIPCNKMWKWINILKQKTPSCTSFLSPVSTKPRPSSVQLSPLQGSGGPSVPLQLFSGLRLNIFLHLMLYFHLWLFGTAWQQNFLTDTVQIPCMRQSSIFLILTSWLCSLFSSSVPVCDSTNPSWSEMWVICSSAFQRAVLLEGWGFSYYMWERRFTFPPFSQFLLWKARCRFTKGWIWKHQRLPNGHAAFWGHLKSVVHLYSVLNILPLWNQKVVLFTILN